MDNSKNTQTEQTVLNRFAKPAHELADSAQELAMMEVDSAKLKTAQALSGAFAKFFSIHVIILAALMFLLVLSGAIILLVGELVGSYALAAFIVAGLLLLVLIILFCRRNRMFRNGFVKIFISAFYPHESEAE